MTGLARLRTVRLVVKDVDEAPAFLNEPKPYLAVVPTAHQPGYVVYTFTARDENGHGSARNALKVRVKGEAGSLAEANAFTVDARSGVVKSALTNYKAGTTYRVFVQADDGTQRNQTGENAKDNSIAMLEVLAGERAPQFFEQKYSAEVQENSPAGTSVLQMESFQFATVTDGGFKGPRKYSLRALNSPTDGEPLHHFNIDADSGLVSLARVLDYDDPATPKEFHYLGVVREDPLESTVPITIRLVDLNDNSPQFTQPLWTATVREDIKIGSALLKVTATDADSGRNGELTYSIDDPHFTINRDGEVQLREHLDADQNKEGFFIYRFNVTARDNGRPARETHSVVRIRTENANDEAPKFLPSSEYKASMAEDAQGGTPIVQIHAVDADRDQITYAFVDPTSGVESHFDRHFEIDRDTGLIRLRTDGVERPSMKALRASSPYNLTVVAKDDDGKREIVHSQLATVQVFVTDVNNNRPSFPHCEDYSARALIAEGTHKSGAPPIVTVKAVDEDSGLNGEVVYSIYYPHSESRRPFVIDATSGELRPSPYFNFDREEKAHEEVTIKATDRGDRPLIGFCSLTVRVEDINDNRPQFDRLLYETSLNRHSSAGAQVLEVLAEDADSGDNGRVYYSLETDTTAPRENADDYRHFAVGKESGIITLAKKISKKDKAKFHFSVRATDHGDPRESTSAQVLVKVNEKNTKLPKWQSTSECQEDKYVDEDIAVNSVLVRCYALVGGEPSVPITYRLSNTGDGGKPLFRHFTEQSSSGAPDMVVVRNMESLDYEKARNHTIILTATDMNSSATTEKHIRIHLNDRNDEVPRFSVDLFTGTIEEELMPVEYTEKYKNKPITRVTATDADSPHTDQSQIHYHILDGGSNPPATNFFRIDELNGAIYPIAKFDREKRDSYIFSVEARDGMVSSLPGSKGPNRDTVKVQIFIADTNDNSPSFKHAQYKIVVREDADVSSAISDPVKAEDPDGESNLRYFLYSPSRERVPFGVGTESGVVYVKSPLDYETAPVYSLKLMATDGKHNVTTLLEIELEDVNDNAPQFTTSPYRVSVLEGDMPKAPILRTHATDKDKRETNGQIVYELEGHGVSDYFQVNRKSGHIHLIKPLDRDPPNGVPLWKFIVRAIDNNGRGLMGYADVELSVEDVNDNAPTFPEHSYGWVDENSPEGAFVTEVKAVDFDDPSTPNAQIEYDISVNKELNGRPVFTIDKHSGKVFVNMQLDREAIAQRQFDIQVRATDKGTPPREGYGNVTITVVDVNDNAPYFEQEVYTALVPETTPIGAPVLTLLALDLDNESKGNVFTYEIHGDPSEHFYVTSDVDSEGQNVGVIRVKKILHDRYHRGRD